MGDLARGNVSVGPGRVVEASWMVGRREEEEARPLRDGPGWHCRPHGLLGCGLLRELSVCVPSGVVHDILGDLAVPVLV
jgi:hypothetical protein